MKGIILAGGSGTRLYPITKATIKQLVPVYDKPMVYYPLSTLMSAGIREILIISTPQDLPRFQELLGDGSQLGCSFRYLAQESPRGIAEAYLIGADFIGQEDVALILGDNLFYGSGLRDQLRSLGSVDGAVGVGALVQDARRYGVFEFDKNKNVLSIVEKPAKPKSNYASAGLYFTDSNVIEITKSLTPSGRGELEISEGVLKEYQKRGKLRVMLLERGTAWLDTGTFESMMDASTFVQIIEKRMAYKIGCIEETAWREGFIDDKQLEQLAQGLLKSGYGQYLLDVLENPSN